MATRLNEPFNLIPHSFIVAPYDDWDIDWTLWDCRLASQKPNKPRPDKAVSFAEDDENVSESEFKNERDKTTCPGDVWES